MERAHVRRLWHVAEDLFETQHKPLEAFLVLHLLLLHRSAEHSSLSAGTTSSVSRHGYVTDAIFDRTTDDKGDDASRDDSETRSTRRSQPPPPPHDLSRPAFPPYLKREEALTRVRAAEMLLCPPSAQVDSATTSSSASAASPVSTRPALSESVSKRASQDALSLAQHVLAPLLPEARTATSTGPGTSSPSAMAMEASISSSGDIDGPTRSSTASLGAAARFATSDYFFSAASVVALAWPSGSFELPIPSTERDEGEGVVEEHHVRVGPSLTLPVIPISVLVRAYLLGASVARRTRRLRRAIALLHMAEAWITETMGASSGSRTVDGDNHIDSNNKNDDDDDDDDEHFQRAVRAMRHDLVARLDEENKDLLFRKLSRLAPSPSGVTTASSEEARAVEALDAVLGQFVRWERWCCLRLVRAELCKTYHALVTTIHAAQLFHISPSPTSAAANASSQALGGDKAGPLKGLTSASLQTERNTDGGSNNNTYHTHAGRSGAAASAGLATSTLSRQFRRASVATLDVKTRMKEYGEYLMQLSHCAAPQPSFAETVPRSGWWACVVTGRLVVSWSAVMGDSFMSAEVLAVRAERAASHDGPQRAGPLEIATSMTLAHYRTLALVLQHYYAACTGAPSPSSAHDTGHSVYGESLAAHLEPLLTTQKRARDEADDTDDADHGVPAARDAAPDATEYDLLYQLALLGFDGRFTQWQQWRCDESRQIVKEDQPQQQHQQHSMMMHWLSHGVRRALQMLLELYATVHAPELPNHESNTHKDAVSGSESEGTLWSLAEVTEERLRDVLRCIDHEMLALSSRQDPSPASAPPHAASTTSEAASTVQSSAVSPPCRVRRLETSPFHQVRLLILMKTSALLLTASAQMQQFNLSTALDHIVNAQSFMGVLYRHVQHIATCRTEMHLIVACFTMQLQLRDVSAAVLDEALAGHVRSSSATPSAGMAPTFLSQLHGGGFAADGASSGTAGGGLFHSTSSSSSSSSSYLAGVASPAASTNLLADLLHDVGLPLFHLVAAEQAAQEGLLYTHPAVRLLVRLLQAYAVFQCASYGASRMAFAQTHHATDGEEGGGTGAPTWRPLATTQRQRCASALGLLLAPLVASFDVYDAEDELATTCDPNASGSNNPTPGWPVAWTPANRVLLLLLRGLWLLMNDHDELSARRLFKKAAQVAKRHLGTLDGLTADALQWLATSAQLSESVSGAEGGGGGGGGQRDEAQPPLDGSAPARLMSSYAQVAMHVAMRCSAAALWRLEERLSDDGVWSDSVQATQDALWREAGFSPVSLSTRWRAAVRDVCGADDDRHSEEHARGEASGGGGSGGAPAPDVREQEPSLMAYKRRKLLVAAVTFLPGTSSYARLT